MIQKARFPVSQLAVLFAVAAAFIILLIVLERGGAPLAFIGWLGLLSFAGTILCLGWIGAAFRPSMFFAAGHSAGIFSLAAAQIVLVLALAKTGRPESPILSLTGIIAAIPAIFLASFLLAPALRRASAYTLTDFFLFRFDSKIPACVAGLVSVVILGLACVNILSFLDLNLHPNFGLPTSFVLGTMALVATLLVFAGGLRAIILLVLILTIATLFSFLAPVLMAVFRNASLPVEGLAAPDLLQLISDRATLWLKASVQSGGVQTVWNFEGQTGPFNRMFTQAGVVETLMLFLGISGVMSLSAIYVAGRDIMKIRRSAPLASMFLLIFIPVAAIAAAGAVTGIESTLVGIQSDAVPLFISDGRLNGLLQICGVDAQGEAIIRACSRIVGPGNTLTSIVIQPANIALHPDALRGGAGLIAGLPLILALLYQVWPVILAAAALALLLFSLASLIGHNLFYRVFAPAAVSSRRLATVRMIWILCLLVLFSIQQDLQPDPRYCGELALTFAASIILPLVLIALVPAAGSRTAILTVLVGTGVTVLMILVLPARLPLAGISGFVAACFMASAALASCPASERERQFGKSLWKNGETDLIMDRGA